MNFSRRRSMEVVNVGLGMPKGCFVVGLQLLDVVDARGDIGMSEEKGRGREGRFNIRC